MVFPSETVMPLAGHISSNGDLSFVGSVVAGTAGSTAGSTLIYLLARIIGKEGVNRFVIRYGRWLGLTVKNTERAGRWFDNHARATVFFGRFVPGIRTAVSMPAGNRAMPFLSFLTFTALGSGLWILLLAFVGYSAREQYSRVQNLTDGVTIIIELGVVVLLIIALIVIRNRSKR